jgi:hypothetical protein
VEEISMPEQKVQMMKATIKPKRVSAAFIRLRGHISAAEKIFSPVQRKKTKEMNSNSYMVAWMFTGNQTPIPGPTFYYSTQ